MASHETIDDHFERLMSRVLDKEATADESAELASRIMRDPAARAVYDDYVRIDQKARAALHTVLIGPVQSHPASRMRRGLWLAAAAGIMAAAAAIGFMIAPTNHGETPRLVQTPTRPGPNPQATERGTVAPTLVSDQGLSGPQALRQMMPRRDTVNVRQDWIGVLDPQTGQMYFLNLNRRNSRTAPLRFER